MRLGVRDLGDLVPRSILRQQKRLGSQVEPQKINKPASISESNFLAAILVILIFLASLLGWVYLSVTAKLGFPLRPFGRSEGQVAKILLALPLRMIFFKNHSRRVYRQ